MSQWFNVETQVNIACKDLIFFFNLIECKWGIDSLDGPFRRHFSKDMSAQIALEQWELDKATLSHFMCWRQDVSEGMLRVFVNQQAR